MPFIRTIAPEAAEGCQRGRLLRCVNRTRSNDIAVLGLLAVLLGWYRNQPEPKPRQQPSASLPLSRSRR